MRVRGFKALRPLREMAGKFSSPPYDVVREMEVIDDIKNGKNLFFKVIRTDALYEDDIYKKAGENLEKFKKEKILVKDEKKSFYIYQEISGAVNQSGLVVTIDIDEYIKGNIKKHAKVLREKESDRTNNFYSCRADTEPVFLFQKENLKLKSIMKSCKTEENKLYDFRDEKNVRHILYKIDDEKVVEKIQEIFEKTDTLYIADGHNRIASAVEVAKKIKDQDINFDRDAEYNFFMAVIFFEDELEILPYNRIIRNSKDYNLDEILEKLSDRFEIKKSDEIFLPEERHQFTIISNEEIYILTAKKFIIEEYDILNSLDTVILHKNIIEPFFKIKNIKNEDEIMFSAAEEILKNIEKYRQDNIIILMYKTTIDQIKIISDTENIMPAKSTWFEPKIRSGLFIHEF